MGAGPKADPTTAIKPFSFIGLAGRYSFPHTNDDFEQVRTLYRNVLSATEKDHLIYNICYSLSYCRPEI